MGRRETEWRQTAITARRHGARAFGYRHSNYDNNEAVQFVSR